MALATNCTQPFTKQALLAIFDRHAPLFSYSINLKMNIRLNTTDDSITIHEHNLSLKRYIEQQFYTVFNDHYDQYVNMPINNYPPQDNQYIWSQQQHILIANIIIETNNIEFIKCINTTDETQFEFLTLTHNQLSYDNIIQKISISFQPSQNYLNKGIHIQDVPIYDINPPVGILCSLNNKLAESGIINNIVLDNGDDQQHDLCHINTKIGNYKCSNSNQYELWYVYCDTTYVNNNKLMEMNIKRWNISDYSSTWHTIQHCHESTTAFIHSANLSVIQSYTCLNRYGIFNMIVKVNLNSRIIDHNLYMYPTPDYFNPIFRLKKEQNQGIKLNINNSILSDLVVVENNTTKGFDILAFHYEDSKLSIIIHMMKNMEYNNLNQTSIMDNPIKCNDNSYEQFNFENCRFDALNLRSK